MTPLPIFYARTELIADPVGFSSPAAGTKPSTRIYSPRRRVVGKGSPAGTIGPMRELAATACVRVVAWGDLVPHSKHSMDVLAALSLDGTLALHSLGTTKSGNPKHPLARGKSRIPDGTQPAVWRRALVAAAA